MAGEMVPFVVKNSAEFSAPEPPSPPVIRMRPSGSKTEAAFVLACERLAAEVQAPIVVGGKPAWRIPTEQIRAKTIHRTFGARFMTMPRNWTWIGEGPEE